MIYGMSRVWLGGSRLGVRLVSPSQPQTPLALISVVLQLRIALDFEDDTARIHDIALGSECYQLKFKNYGTNIVTIDALLDPKKLLALIEEKCQEIYC